MFMWGIEDVVLVERFGAVWTAWDLTTFGEDEVDEVGADKDEVPVCQFQVFISLQFKLSIDRLGPPLDRTHHVYYDVHVFLRLELHETCDT